jgi:hypothetical protein
MVLSGMVDTDSNSGTTPIERDPAAKRSTPAERMRLHRERRSKGLRCLMIELRETEVAALIRKGLLKFETRNDPNAVRGALYDFFDRTLDATS